jgi:cytosine/adenosine deaminase-related metal-dependent hydrolase
MRLTRSGPYLTLLAVGLSWPAPLCLADPPVPTAAALPAAGTIACETLPEPPAGQVCAVTPRGRALLLKGAVLADTSVFEGGAVLVDATGLIRYVGCAADLPVSLATLAAVATRIDCKEGVISPGLINAHDHLSFDHNAPLPDSGQRFDHRNDWRPASSTSSDPGQAKMTWSELRQAMVGTTSILGSSAVPGVLRNLDRQGTPEHPGYPLFDDHLWNASTPRVIVSETFPLERGSDYTENAGDCSAFPLFPGLAPGDAGSDEYVPHVAEGINAAARNEFACLSATDRNGVDVVDSGFSMIHGIALTAEDGDRLARSGAAVIWSPRSNIALYGNTAPVTMLKNEGVLLALGTDWTPSGSAHLARELACADALNRSAFDGAFSDRDLWLMATRNPAVALGVEDRLGALRAGLFGDIAVYDGRGKANPYRALIEAGPESTVLVLHRSSLPFPFLTGQQYAGSIGVYGDAAVMSALPSTPHDVVAPFFGVAGPLCENLDVCGRSKRLCPLRETWWLPFALLGRKLSLSALQAGNAGSYSLFSCGVPEGEPTCVPVRPGEYPLASTAVEDHDADGIPDDSDDCVRIFNPVRPMDGGLQADGDHDGRGDACDRCPVDPNDTCGP